LLGRRAGQPHGGRRAGPCSRRRLLRHAAGRGGRGEDPCALLLHYAGLDQRTNAGIPAFREALEKDGKAFQIYVYEGANHAFNNDTSAARYDKKAADLAWRRTVAFLHKYLS